MTSQAGRSVVAVNRVTTSGSASYILWLVMPFASLLYAINNYRATWAKNIIWLFVIFYGYTFVISNDQLDSNRYKLALLEMSQKPATSLTEFSILLYGDDTDYVDILQPLLTFIISRFTADSRILFACFGLIFGFFYSRNVWFLLSIVGNRIKREAFPFLFLFIFVVSIWQLNGFRFATATHVFIYGLMLFFKGKKNKGFIFCIASLFVHFSFILPVIILFLHWFIGNRLIVCFSFFFVSFFVLQVTPEVLSGYIETVPIVFRARTENYTNADYVNELAKVNKKTVVNWYVTWRMVGLIYVTNLLLAIMFLKYRKLLGQHQLAASLLCYSLLLFSVANILSTVPSVGIRFQLVSMVILFGAIFFFVQANKQKLFPMWARVPLIAVTLLYVVVEIRIGFSTMGIMTIIGNPFIAPFVQNDIPLINLIK